MLRSMTAFARTEHSKDWGQAVWEIRSVNHRYLDVFVRLPDELRILEPEVRQRVAACLKRGKVECNLKFKPGGDTISAISINHQIANRLADAIKEIKSISFDAASPNAIEMLRWPGVIEPQALDLETISANILQSLDETLAELVETREREGNTIAEFMNDRLDAMAPHIETARARIPEIIEQQRERVRNRLQEVQAELDSSRVEQELVLFSQKIDVAEELNRLETHIKEVTRVVNREEPAGRRLDFLMQELNREANTLSSKSIAADTTQAAVELKVIIEQMREQVQNVE